MVRSREGGREGMRGEGEGREWRRMGGGESGRGEMREVEKRMREDEE